MKKETLLLEMMANMAIGSVMDELCSAMSDRKYELAAQKAASLLTMASSLTLIKDANEAPDPEMIIMKSVEYLQLEVNSLNALIGDGGDDAKS